ncbi:MAG: RNA methyltransferase [Bacillota bacterium]
MQEIPWRLTKSLSSKKERDKTSLTVAEGPPSVTSALESGVAVEFLAVSESYANSDAYAGIERSLEFGGRVGQVYVVPDALFDRMSETRTPQGILCVLPVPFRYLAGPPESPWKVPLFLYGVDIQDPGNAGTLIRAAAAAGVTGAVFAGESADVFSPKCIRASAGAVFKTRVSLEDPGEDALSILKGLEAQGVRVYKAVPRGGDPPWAARLSESCAIVVGNEARGLSKDVIDGPGRTLSIPMPGDTESMNVALASGVMLYEAVRQRLLSERPVLMV